MAYRRRTDGNHSDVANVFRALGCRVEHTSHFGAGFADMVVALHQSVRFVEVKNPMQPPSKRRLTKPEKRFAELLGDLYRVVETTEDVVRLVNEMRGYGEKTGLA